MCGSFKIAIELKSKVISTVISRDLWIWGHFGEFGSRARGKRTGGWGIAAAAGEIPRAAERIPDGRSCIFPGCDSDAKRFPSLRHGKGGTYASVRPDIAEIRTRLSEQFPSTAIISPVPGIGGSAGGGNEEEGNRRLRPVCLFIKRGWSARRVRRSLTAPTWGRREIAMLHSEFGALLFFFYSALFPLRSYLSLNVSFSRSLFSISGPEESRARRT